MKNKNKYLYLQFNCSHLLFSEQSSFNKYNIKKATIKEAFGLGIPITSTYTDSSLIHKIVQLGYKETWPFNPKIISHPKKRPTDIQF